MKEIESLTIIPKNAAPTESRQPVPDYIIELPTGSSLEDIDFLRTCGLKTRTRNALVRGGITTISDLATMSDDQLRIIRDISSKSINQIEVTLTRFQEIVTNESTNLTPGLVLVLKLQLADIQQASFLGNPQNTKIVRFIQEWCQTHPTSWGSISAAAKQFGLTPARAQQIIAKYQQISNEQLTVKRQENYRLADIASRLGVSTRTLVDLIRAQEFSFDPQVDKYYTTKPEGSVKPYRRRLIKATPEELSKLINILREKLDSPKRAMALLTLSIANRNKNLYWSLSQVARNAGIVCPRRMSEIYQLLIDRHFNLRRFPAISKDEIRGYYYFVHHSEAEAIVNFVKASFKSAGNGEENLTLFSVSG